MKDSDPYKVIEEFYCRMTGTLKAWYHNLGSVRQNQFHELGTTVAVLGVLHEEIIGDGAIIDKKLENTYVAFLPPKVQPELNRMAMAAQKDFSTLTMGQIHQMTQEVVDKLCRQHKYFSDVMNQKGKFNKACKKSYLEIKCKDKTCSCSSKKKKREVQPPKKRRKSFKFFRKKKIRGKTFDQRCFICGKKGHYSRNCPNKADKAIKLISSLNLEDEEVESLHSEQSSANDETVFASKESEDEYQLEADSIPIFSIEKLDTDRKAFKTDLITKDPVGIKIFPECVIWSRVIGSKMPDKDILIGMDVYSAANKLQILSTGVRYKREFKPFTEALKLFSFTEAHAEIEEIKKKMFSLCANNHEEFTHPNPIWKNLDFFIRLPFKLNKDVNPTKATHPGMTPSNLLLARQECHELLRQGLIEPTQSNWACQAFYVEKRSEKLRGKKRLVIDYKPLNHFLQDDKFPILKASSLPVLLKKSNIFSKFDLKYGFWKLGIDPADKHKTTFCIPNAQYQWTVLPFGLKVAPSLFQKAMTRIFEPLLEHAIIYINDIQLFSKNMETHKALLNQFFDIANQYGLMFSEKKIHLAQSKIDFLGMHFSQGIYQPQPHIAEELLKFPDQSLTVKQIQQFLGIVNYIRDFIPHVAKYTSPLSKLLKKDPPPWGLEQTQAIQELKKIVQSPPALKIPGEGKRILQTDASDFY
ncbi:hypothetical protein CR513_06399, partial [Mucuna pruriens]